MHLTRPLAFVGLAGVGKSAIARRVGARLGVPVCDSDALVVERAGRSVAEIFASDGESVFRAMETTALRDVLALDPPVVVATGGGIVEAASNRALLAAADVVLLDTSDEVLCDRLRRSSTKRPLLEGDLEANVATLRARRDPLYRDVADLVVVVGTDDVATTAAMVGDRILERWPNLSAAPVAEDCG